MREADHARLCATGIVLALPGISRRSARRRAAAPRHATRCNRMQPRATWCNLVQPHATWCNLVQPTLAFWQNEPTVEISVVTSGQANLCGRG